MTASKYLTTCLNGRLADSTIGLERARRAASENEARARALPVQLGEEIAEDRRALEELMDPLSVGTDNKRSRSRGRPRRPAG